MNPVGHESESFDDTKLGGEPKMNPVGHELVGGEPKMNPVGHELVGGEPKMNPVGHELVGGVPKMNPVGHESESFDDTKLGGEPKMNPVGHELVGGEPKMNPVGHELVGGVPKMNPVGHESFSFDYTKPGGEPDAIHKKFKETISKAPRNNEWTRFTKLFQYQGFWQSALFLEGTILAQEGFRPRSNDVILCSAPKTGTTWLKALAFAIVTRSDKTLNDLQHNPLVSSTPHECVPYIEIDLFQRKQTQYPEIPLVATHLPYVSLPKSIKDSNCKLVYISRDPKDVVVSLWHFIGNFKNGEEEEEESMKFPLEKAVELFCKGISLNGPYWDHVLEYWKASLEWPDRVLFLKYEDLKRETNVWVKRLAEFMGFPFSSEEEVEKVVGLCSFENLSSLEVNKNGDYMLSSAVKMKNCKYFRKGEVGDWKTCLSEEDRERIDKISEERLKDSGLVFHE